MLASKKIPVCQLNYIIFHFVEEKKNTKWRWAWKEGFQPSTLFSKRNTSLICPFFLVPLGHWPWHRVSKNRGRSCNLSAILLHLHFQYSRGNKVYTFYWGRVFVLLLLFLWLYVDFETLPSFCHYHNPWLVWGLHTVFWTNAFLICLCPSSCGFANVTKNLP